jgi:hypothetical protein
LLAKPVETRGEIGPGNRMDRRSFSSAPLVPFFGSVALTSAG